MAKYKDYLNKPDFINMSTVTDPAKRQDANNRFARQKPRPQDPDTITQPVTTPTTTTIKKEKPKVNTTPQYYRDKDTGEITGVSLPSGENISGDADKIARVVAGYENRSNVQLEKKVSLQEQQVAQQQALEQPSSVTPQDLSSIGNYGVAYNDLTKNVDDTTRNIVTNIQEADNASKFEVLGVGLNDFTGALKGLTNKFTGKTGGIIVEPGIKAAINFLTGGDNKAQVERYFNDYSNQDSYNLIISDIADAQTKITEAIELSNIPGQSDISIQGYNVALARLRKADAQLKLIGDNDKKAYVSDVIIQRSKIDNYFNKGGKTNDDIKIRDNIQKANMVR